MNCSVSGQDELIPALLLANQVDKLVLSCPLKDYLLCPQEEFSRKPYNKSFTDQGGSVKMAGYWPIFLAYLLLDIGLIFCCKSLETLILCLSVNMQKKKQPISSH